MSAAAWTRLSPEAIDVAAEHIGWCVSRRWIPYDVFAALGVPAPLRPSWGNALWAGAKAWEALHDEALHDEGRGALRLAS